MKRFLDVLISLSIIIICTPLIVAILFIVSVVTDDSPLLIQERKIHLTKSGIKIIKIRTIKASNTARHSDSIVRSITKANKEKPPLHYL